MTRLERILAGLLALGLALLFLCNGLPSGVAPVSIDPLYADAQAVPFSEVRPPDFVAHNAFLSDQAMVFYPWLEFMSAAVRRGEMPLWSPQSGGGQPFIANLSSAFFFPLTWLSFLPPDLLSVARGMLWAAVIKLWLAGWFGYLFLRAAGAGRSGAAAGAVGFAIFGYQVVWLFYSLSNVSCLLPLCLWLTQRVRAQPDAARCATLAAALALQFLGGHAETSLALAVAATAWIVCAPAPPDAPPRARVLPRFAIAGVAALALCAFQLLPFAEYLQLSQGRYERELLAQRRAEGGLLEGGGVLRCAGAVAAFCVAAFLLRRDGSARGSALRGACAGVALGLAIAAWRTLGMDLPRLLLALAPDALGSPLRGAGYHGPETYTDVNGGFAGALLTLLAVLYLIAGRRRGIAAFGALLLALAWGLHGRIEPLYSLLKSIPPFDIAADSRMLPLAGAAACTLGAFALGELRERGRWLRALLRVAACAGVAGAIAVAFAPAPLPVAIGGRDVAGLAIALAAVAAFALVPRAAPAAAALVAVELFLFGFDYNAFVPEAQVFPRTSLTDAIEREAVEWRASGRGPFRVLCEGVILQPNMNYAYDLQVVRSYDQLDVRAWHQLVNEWIGGVPLGQYSHRTLDYRSPLMALFGLAYVASGEALDGVAGLVPVFAGKDGAGRLYRNPAALPRAFVVPDAVVVPPAGDPGLDAVRRLDPRAHAFVDAEVPGAGGGKGSVTFRRYDLNRIEMEAETDAPALVIVADNAFPGWRAQVNGEPAPIHVSHGTLRAVAVPAGRSTIEMEYRPASLTAGAWLAAAAAALLVLWIRREKPGSRQGKPDYHVRDVRPAGANDASA